jgi:hypothetical protein
MEFDIKLIFNRIKIAKGFKRDAELARFLQITPQNLSNCIIRNTVDWKNLLSNCVDISVDWLLTGKGEMFRNSSENATEEKEKPTKTTQFYEEINSYLLKRVKELEEELSDLKDHHDSDDAQDVDRGSCKKTGTM